MKVAEENMEKNMEEAAEEVTDNKTETGQNTETDQSVEDAAAESVKEEKEETAQEEKKDKKFWKKEKKDKNAELVEELTDKVKRQMAEFENFRKRSEKEKAGMFEMGAKSVIEQILPVIDNFERGLAAVPEESKADPFVEGMEKIYRQFMDTMDKLNVKPIEAVGTEFNPDFHNAVMHVEDEEAGENVVVEEFQKGYLYKDQVVRHSMVKVAN
ncbi:MAG: nucleotide exchange factor GrpE [Lachnospiraceae bacterium]|nr:nucleotide exchange factor GrpE [Lachnospiraceae bacterium]MCQ4772494.1 nucleotide exchange factor GrpE [Lacrimispora saccharolytica]MDD7435794.1 nucleotide exchange factor GrpE [Lachnospiraceae bacterium]MDY3343330.1 nucleotide exchange factor GrpE [Lachnospiraceae bacterium]